MNFLNLTRVSDQLNELKGKYDILTFVSHI